MDRRELPPEWEEETLSDDSTVSLHKSLCVSCWHDPDDDEKKTREEMIAEAWEMETTARTELLGEIDDYLRSDLRNGPVQSWSHVAAAIQAKFGTPGGTPHKCQACLRMIREPADHDAECLFGGTEGGG